MSSPFATYPAPGRTFIAANPQSAVPNQQTAAKTTTTQQKRGRKPRTSIASTAASPVVPTGSLPASQSQSQPMSVQWAAQQTNTTGPSTPAPVSAASPAATSTTGQEDAPPVTAESSNIISLSGVVLPAGSGEVANGTASARPSVPPGATQGEEDGEGEDELLPAMADDDYSAQLSWQSQSKDNLKVLMDNFSPAQYDRFEAYRRHALPKQAVRKVIQQTLGQQVSQPVAQIVAGFGKVFVGEMVEKARAVQARRGEHGPLSPDHLREAYRLYQQETGRVGAARPVRSKRLFVR